MAIRHLSYEITSPEDFLDSYISGKRKFTNLFLKQGSYFSSLNFEEIHLVNANIFQIKCLDILLDNANFNGTNLSNSRIINSQLMNSNFQDACLRDSILSDIIIINCDLSGANLIDANLQNIKLDNVNFSNAQYSDETKFPSNFSPMKEGMVLVNPDNLVLDALLKIPFVKESKFDSYMLENWEGNIDELDSIQTVLESLYKILLYKKDIHSSKFIEENHLECDFWEISKFSSVESVGCYLDFHAWLAGNFHAYTFGKFPGVWTIFYSKEFLKSTFQVDSELGSKILEAEKQIRSNPCTILGDTIKPLTGKFKGLWRYRIGDVRIVYYPNKETRNILMVTISSRGKVYSEIRSSKEYKEKLCNLRIH